jgi:hypothetical protein
MLPLWHLEDAHTASANYRSTNPAAFAVLQGLHVVFDPAMGILPL